MDVEDARTLSTHVTQRKQAHNTTLDDDNSSTHVTSDLVTALGNQPKAFASDLGDDQSLHLLTGRPV